MLLPTSGENAMATTPLEIYLLRKIVTYSMLILPVYIFFYVFFIIPTVKLCSVFLLTFSKCDLSNQRI